MTGESLFQKVHDLSDLELATLLSLIAREHCLISTPEDGLDDLIEELQLVASKTFGLSCVVVNCDSFTTVDSFASSLLLEQPQTPGSSLTPRHNILSESYFSARPRQYQPTSIGDQSLRIANIVLARNLDRAPHAVQIQALELLRTRRIFTRTAVHAAPKQFLFVPLLGAESGGQARVTRHLNDFLLLAHWHNPEDGYVNLEEEDNGFDDETASTGSIVKTGTPGVVKEALISETDVNDLAKLSQQVEADVDVTRYQMNIISFLRMHRAVADGISPAATKHLEQLARCLAPLHNVDFVTPALVGLAVRKVYLHRIRITPPEKERSMQWGSKLDAVEAVLEGVGPEEVIEDVLAMVTPPL